MTTNNMNENNTQKNEIKEETTMNKKTITTRNMKEEILGTIGNFIKDCPNDDTADKLIFLQSFESYINLASIATTLINNTIKYGITDQFTDNVDSIYDQVTKMFSYFKHIIILEYNNNVTVAQYVYNMPQDLTKLFRFIEMHHIRCTKFSQEFEEFVSRDDKNHYYRFYGVNNLSYEKTISKDNISKDLNNDYKIGYADGMNDLTPNKNMINNANYGIGYSDGKNTLADIRQTMKQFKDDLFFSEFDKEMALYELRDANGNLDIEIFNDFNLGNGGYLKSRKTNEVFKPVFSQQEIDRIVFDLFNAIMTIKVLNTKDDDLDKDIKEEIYIAAGIIIKLLPKVFDKVGKNSFAKIMNQLSKLDKQQPDYSWTTKSSNRPIPTNQPNNFGRAYNQFNPDMINNIDYGIGYSEGKNVSAEISDRNKKSSKKKTRPNSNNINQPNPTFGSFNTKPMANIYYDNYGNPWTSATIKYPNYPWMSMPNNLNRPMPTNQQPNNPWATPNYTGYVSMPTNQKIKSTIKIKTTYKNINNNIDNKNIIISITDNLMNLLRSYGIELNELNVTFEG